jgi:hypothetical protein
MMDRIHYNSEAVIEEKGERKLSCKGNCDRTPTTNYIVEEEEEQL